jgi:hypothetical protein
MTEMLDSKPNGVYLLLEGQWIHLPHLGDPLKTPPSGLLRSTRSFINKPEVLATIPRGEITLFIKGMIPGSFKINQLNEDGEGGVQLFEGDTIKAEGKVESIAQGISLLRLTSPSMPDGYVQVQLIGPNRGPVSYHLLRLKR